MALRDDRLKWNRRYQEREGGPVRPEPNPLALRWRHLWIGGPMLDAACGLGRGIASVGDAFNPIYAIDLSEVGLAAARELWREREGIHWIVGDVGAMAWPAATFGLVCAFGFTDMAFFARVPRLLRPGGMFLSEGFAERQREVKPHLNDEWIVRPAEMRRLFAKGRVLECSATEEPPYRIAFAAIVP